MMFDRTRYKIGVCITVFLLFTGSFTINGQIPQQLSWSDVPQGVKTIHRSSTELTLQIDISSIRLMEIKSDYGSFYRILHPGFVPSNNDGEPELPQWHTLIELPQNSKVVVDQITYIKKVFDLNAKGFTGDLYPHQPSRRKQTDPVKQPFVYHKGAYLQNHFIEDSIVVVKQAGILRGRQLAMISVSPFRYNPVTHTLEVKDHITLTLSFKGGDMAKTSLLHKSLSTPAFENTFAKSIFNYQPEPSKSVASPPLKMVILTDSVFRYSLDDFIRWKRQKGIEVEVAYRGDPVVGSTVEEMKAYLGNLYHSATPENPAPTYLLIIGDVQQIPASSTVGQYTDLYYATYDSIGDYLPDIYFGRFSARDSTELAAILEKNLEYEQFLFPDPSFLGEAVMIAGVDAAYAQVWGNGQINYGTENYYNTDHGVQSHTYLYPVSGSSDAQIIQDISNGVGFVNYTGHGDSDEWIDPTFSIADIGGLTNSHKYPLMIGNGCVTATYGLAECFAEALIRAPGKGALSYIGCSNDSYWDEDYYWAVGVGPIVEHPTYAETGLGMYDRLFHDHGEPDTDWYINQSQMVFAGNMAVMTGNPSRAKYYWEIYQLLGDPSLMVYLSDPETLNVQIPETLPLGITNATIITEDHTVITLTQNDTILASAFSNNDGMAYLNFPALTTTGDLRVTGIRQNRKPFVDSIEVISNSDPYVFLEQVLVNDSLTNANGLPDAGETFFLATQIKNAGLTDATNVTATLTASSSDVTLTDSTMEILPVLPAQQDTMIYRAFEVRVKDSIPDNAIVTCKITFRDQRDSTWNSFFTLTLHAPDLMFGTLTVNDQEKGNGNHRLEPGEIAKLNLGITNIGSTTSDSIMIRISMPDSMVSFYEDTVYADPLSPASIAEIPVSLVIKPDVAYGTLLHITAGLVSGEYSKEKEYTIPVGLSYDDFELGNLSAVPWTNDPSKPWIVTDENAWEGTFSARSGTITDSQVSSLSIDLEVFQDDSVHFYARVSSEKDYDYLRFFIDDTEAGKWSGELPWTNVSFPVSQGNHTLTWKYTKDGSVKRGYDATWIDYVVFPTFSFSSMDVAPMEILSPKSGTGLSDSVSLSFSIRNLGKNTLDQIPVGYRIDQGSVVLDTLETIINPGDTATFTFSQPLNLEILKSYALEVFTSLPGDQVPINDTLRVSVVHEGDIDITVDSLLSPVQDSIYTFEENIGIRIINLSSGAVTGIPVTYVINQQTPVTETIDEIIPMGDTLNFFFSQPGNMADSGLYFVTVYSEMPEDVVLANDSIHIVLYNISNGTPHIFSPDEIRLYPNPVSNDLNLKIGLRATVYLTIQIADISGMVLYRTEANYPAGMNQITLPTTRLSRGTYFLILSGHHLHKALPFIKIGK